MTPSPRSSSSSPQLRRVSRSPKTRGPAARPAPPDYSRWIRVSKSGIHGKGVYAKVLIPAGTQIIEYVGEKITKAEARRREEQRIERLEAGGDGCVTIFDLNRRHDLDARDSRTPARLINHSCTPNCRSENSRGHIWVVATRDIAIGEEITFDYGFPLSEWSLHPCRCGVPSCAGLHRREGAALAAPPNPAPDRKIILRPHPRPIGPPFFLQETALPRTIVSPADVAQRPVGGTVTPQALFACSWN